MLRKLGLALLASLIGGWSQFAAADTGLVTGDSLGVGVSMASRLKSFAKNSVSIRASSVPVEQIGGAPAGSFVFLSLGTNDAVSDIRGLDGGIDRIVQAAAKAKVHLVWIGPPCVFKPWDKNAVALDGILKQDLHGTAVTYVSMRDDKLCSRSVRAPDGVHFNMTGYHFMWDKARDAAGFTVEASNASPENAATFTPAKHKLKKRKRRAHRRSAPTRAAPADAAVPAAAASPAPQQGSSPQ